MKGKSKSCGNCTHYDPARNFCTVKVEPRGYICLACGSFEEFEDVPEAMTTVSTGECPSDGLTVNGQKAKRCPKCGRILPLSEFYSNRSKKDGLSERCKTCIKEDNAARKLAGKESGKEVEAAAAPEVEPAASCDPMDFIREAEIDKLVAELRRRGYSGKVVRHEEIEI